MANTSQAHEIKLIQIGRTALRLDTATYQQMLANLCGGKTSSKALTSPERQAVLNHMKARGFVVKPKAAPGAAPSSQREPQMLKLRKLWYLLADAGAVERPANAVACMAAVERWALRQLSTTLPPVLALRFASGDQVDALIEQAKAWCRRVGAALD